MYVPHESSDCKWAFVYKNSIILLNFHYLLTMPGLSQEHRNIPIGLLKIASAIRFEDFRRFYHFGAVCYRQKAGRPPLLSSLHSSCMSNDYEDVIDDADDDTDNSDVKAYFNDEHNKETGVCKVNIIYGTCSIC